MIQCRAIEYEISLSFSFAPKSLELVLFSFLLYNIKKKLEIEVTGCLDFPNKSMDFLSSSALEQGLLAHLKNLFYWWHTLLTMGSSVMRVLSFFSVHVSFFSVDFLFKFIVESVKG